MSRFTGHLSCTQIHPSFFSLSLLLCSSPVWGKRSAEEFGAAVRSLPARGLWLFLLLWRLPGWAPVHAAEIPAAGEQRAHWLPWKTPQQVGNTKWCRQSWLVAFSGNNENVFDVSVYLSLFHLTAPPPVLHQRWGGLRWVFSTWWCLQYSVPITKTATSLQKSLGWGCVPSPDFYVWHLLLVTALNFQSLVLFPQAQPFWYRCVYVLIWGKISLYKYVSCWVIAVSFLFDPQEYAWKLDC